MTEEIHGIVCNHAFKLTQQKCTKNYYSQHIKLLSVHESHPLYWFVGASFQRQKSLKFLPRNATHLRRARYCHGMSSVSLVRLLMLKYCGHIVYWLGPLQQEQQQLIAVGSGNVHCMSIRQVLLRRGTCGHYSVARRCYCSAAAIAVTN